MSQNDPSHFIWLFPASDLSTQRFALNRLTSLTKKAGEDWLQITAYADSDPIKHFHHFTIIWGDVGIPNTSSGHKGHCLRDQQFTAEEVQGWTAS